MTTWRPCKVHNSRPTLNRPVYVDNNVLHLSEHLKYALMKGYLMKYASDEGAVKLSLRAPVHGYRLAAPRYRN